MKKLLFVCLGNICRSPSAEGIMRAIVKEKGCGADFELDSAGTGDWHIGQAPDPRAQAASKRAGVDISGLRARQVTISDFDRFDLILACDRQNYADLCAMQPKGSHAKVELLMHFSGIAGAQAVPDPYYGTDKDFDETVRLCRKACEGLLASLKE